ncbi:ATP-binding protein [uncultured Roseibium sp.]|uniref:ATP-binding protein n=1 Tax=uncultured Roseibium sp. TaxID=1936171 RepID=UPI0032162475
MTAEPQTEAVTAAPARQRSLAGRLVLFAAVWSTLALVIAGFILVGLYRAAGERAFDSQLEVHLNTIIGEMVSSETTGGATPGVKRPENLPEPRFSLPLSGWYWTVRKADQSTILFASPSLVGDPLTLPQLGDRESLSGFAEGPRNEEVRFLQSRITIENVPYVIAVAAETEGFREEVSQFARQVGLTLLIFGAGLVGAIFLQVRVGLRPLSRLRASLLAVRMGEAESIDENLPREIAPLAVELNALILSNREIVERARTHVGNLAHGLKTPLSVIANEARANPGPLADKVGEQASIMSTQIQHHLERARMAAQRRVIGVSCEVEPVLSRLVRAMDKIYQRRGIEVESSISGGIRFRGEQQDMEEMAGNLIDNACKWASSQVTVTVQVLNEGGSARSMFELVVEDDGPGLSEEERKEAVKRGRRLDETVPGTGLGLSIVADLAALYGGRLELERAGIGGLRTRLVLPAL